MVEVNANATTLPDADELILVGREPELARFKKILKDGQPLLAVITGAAGVGKSSLLRAFQIQAETAGWSTVPSVATSEILRVTPETTQESFSNQVQKLIAVPSGKSFIEKSPGKSPIEALPNQQPLLSIVEQLRARAPLLLLIDGYEPEAEFIDWFQNLFMNDVKHAGASLIIVIAERSEGLTKISLSADELIALGMLEKQVIEQHLVIIGEQINPPIEKDELNVLVEAAYKNPELLSSLTRVLRLALQSNA